MKFNCFVTSSLILILLFKLEITATPDADLSLSEIFHKYGYPFERHEIETQDGYLLDLFRVPHGRYSNYSRSSYPVLIMHGLSGTADEFAYLGPKRSLAYILADHGYDVWLGNARGNMHSRKHRSLDPDKNKTFWHFSWHEIAVYDQPAMINYILKVTGFPRLFFIGYSQGGTTYLAMSCEVPEINNKIYLSIGLSPGVFYNNMSKVNYIKRLSQIHEFFYRLVTTLNAYEVLPFIPNAKIRKIMRRVCDSSSSIQSICKKILMMLVGADPSQLDQTLVPFIVSRLPGGSSIFQAIHYAQNMKTESFRPYDFGPEVNLQKYKSKVPPDYNLTKSVAPFAVLYGVNDEFATYEDLMKLIKILPNVVDVYQIPYKQFTHLDFIFARDGNIFYIRRLLKVMEKYKGKK